LLLALPVFSTSALAAEPVSAPVATVDFVGALRELRSAVGDISTQRAAAQKKGDKLREICLYERQRALSQALDNAEAARLGWEAATKAGDEAKVRVEQTRAQRTLELARNIRSAAETCGGTEPASAKPTQVTVSGPGLLDDPQAGPREPAAPNSLRLELPSRPNPASMFRPSR
jgi:hypothetical protein